MTTSEEILWNALRNRRLGGWKFRRQHPVDGYVLDFYCAEEKLAVEIDGAVHQDQADADAGRQEILEARGLRFVRISAALVQADLDKALWLVTDALDPRSPSPRGGEGARG
jgi:adenine-specific DNA-methyltransferase